MDEWTLKGQIAGDRFLQNEKWAVFFWRIGEGLLWS